MGDAPTRCQVGPVDPCGRADSQETANLQAAVFARPIASSGPHLQSAQDARPNLTATGVCPPRVGRAAPRAIHTKNPAYWVRTVRPKSLVAIPPAYISGSGYIFRAMKSYLLKGSDEEMARWRAEAERQRLTFAEFIRRALEHDCSRTGALPPPQASLISDSHFKPDPKPTRKK